MDFPEQVSMCCQVAGVQLSLEQRSIGNRDAGVHTATTFVLTRPSMRQPALLPGLVAAILISAVQGVSAEPYTPRFKNLQVLPENSTAAEVTEVMKLMTRALGTQCVACHQGAEREYHLDALPLKHTARTMMRLEEQRRASLNWLSPPADLCLACHQGQLRPPAPVEGE
jgi:hypothetical protein